jgi:hypothetical protein
MNPPQGCIPNPRRNPNPFCSTSESDWVHVPQPNIAGGNGGVMQNTEKSNTVSKSSPLLVPRRARPSIPQEPPGGERGAVVGLPSRRSSTLSGSSDGLSKRPPPIPKKPATMSGDPTPTSLHNVLSQSAPVLTLGEDQPPKGTGSGHQIPLSPRQMVGQKRALTSHHQGITPPVQLRDTKSGIIPQEQQPDVTPSLPPRIPLSANDETNRSELLDEEVGENMAFWKPLSPQNQL